MKCASHSNFEIKNKTIFDAFEMYDNTFLNYGRIASVQFRLIETSYRTMRRALCEGCSLF